MEKTFPRFPKDSRRRLCGCFTDRLKATLFLTPRNNLDGADVILIQTQFDSLVQSSLSHHFVWVITMVFHTVLHQFLLVQVSGPTERTHKCWPVWNIAAYKRTHTHTQIITRLGRRVCICVTVKLNMYRCIQSHRQLRCWKMCPTNLNLYLEKVTNVTFTQIHWELQTHSHYRSVITASQIRKAQLWVTHVHFGNASLCDQTALVLQTAALLNKIEALWTLTAEQCVPLWDTPSWPLNHYHVPQHWVNTGSLCQLQLCYWL